MVPGPARQDRAAPAACGAPATSAPGGGNMASPEERPTTDRRALTSPMNGRKSQGPKTPRGKEVSRFNATKHGLLARHLLVDDGVAPETAAELRRLHKQLRAELAPDGIVEEMLVERLL